MTEPDRPDAIGLIVNADDFGITERINAGIAAGHQHGIITAASLMATGRAFEDAIRWSHALPALDVGVHLTAVAEKPLLQSASSLVGPDGRFPPDANALALAWLSGKIERDHVAAEWSAQIERVLAQGITVTHLDSHQHVHVLPCLANLTRALARKYGIPFVRLPIEPWHACQLIGGQDLRRLAGSMVLRALWLLARLAGARRHQDRFLTFLGFQDGGRLSERRLRRLLQCLRPGRVYELMCHPGHRPDEPELQGWEYSHEKELQALSSPSIRALIAARGIQLTTFGLTATKR